MALTPALIFADIDSELAATRRVLDRVPDQHLAWSPHLKSMPLGKLAGHIVDIHSNLMTVLETSELDFAANPPPRVATDSSRGILAAFDAVAPKLAEAIKNASEEALQKTWTLRMGDRVFFTTPKVVTLRSFGFSHIAHHRAQLTVYLRLLDIPVPSVYGPTADEGL
ncbi:MAG TPA: DinB family protein [Gemmatimonadales bacterium]|nr:DinB family protein [Gemmatimonadales bacterium]